MSSSSTSPDNKDDEKNKLRVALCQFQVTEDKETNHLKCAKFLERASQAGAKLIVLPEIWSSPYATAAFPEYAEVLPSVGNSDDDTSSSAQVLRRAAIQHQVWIVGGSIPERGPIDNKIYNTCLVYDPKGRVVAKHRKVHLFDVDIPGGITFRESDTLSCGNDVTDFDMLGIGKVGIGICYDLRFAAYSAVLRQRGCQILVFPGAFNLTTGPAHWELLQRSRAVDNQCFVLSASPARSAAPPNSKYPHYTAWGHSTVVSPWGEVLATTNEGEDVVIADLDLGKVEQIRNAIPISKQQRNDLYNIVETASK